MTLELSQTLNIPCLEQVALWQTIMRILRSWKIHYHKILPNWSTAGMSILDNEGEENSQTKSMLHFPPSHKKKWKWEKFSELLIWKINKSCAGQIYPILNYQTWSCCALVGGKWCQACGFCGVLSPKFPTFFLAGRRIRICIMTIMTKPIRTNKHNI